MLVSQLLKSKGEAVFTALPHETLQGAATMLHARRVGAMVVMDGDHVVGILSERDVVRAVSEQGGAALSRPISEVMSRDVIFAEPKEPLDLLLERMTDRRIRHLPVCQDGRLIGIVSIGDLVKAKIAETEAEAQTLKAYIAAG
jgi:CBS domain-containing protein